jgi:ATP-binding cassette, subfamily B, bacterial MsbA
MSALHRLLLMSKPHLASLIMAYICMGVFNLVTVFYAALLGPGLNVVFTGDTQSLLKLSDQTLRPGWDLMPDSWLGALEHLSVNHAIWLMPLLLVLLSLIKGLAQTGQFFIFGRVSQKILMTIRRQAFSSMLLQDPTFFSKSSHGDLLSRLTNDANDVERAFFYGYGALLRDSLAVLSLLAYLFYADATLALFTFITVPVAVWPLVHFGKWMKKVSLKGQSAHADINTRSYEALSGSMVVQAFSGEERELQRFDQASLAYFKQMLRSYFIRAVRTPTMEVLGAVAVGCLFAFLGSKVQKSSNDPAHYISFLGAILFMYDPLKKLGKVTDFLAIGASAAERLFAIIDLKPGIENTPDAVVLPPFEKTQDNRIRFEGVTFSYPSSETKVLDGFDLELKRGDVVALVGKSGAGKTTVAHLLPRFYDIDKGQGTIRVGGADIRQVEFNSLRSQISLVGQDTFLFNSSIKDNISYASPAADKSAIEQAATLAYAHHFIEELPEGYDTIVGERGLRLSGGQRQRIAIARAILRDAPILIFDEATSHLDSDSEHQVQKALQNLLKNRTALVIAHRLSTIQRADHICVMENGNVIESGTHEELLKHRGEYQRLYELQFGHNFGESDIMTNETKAAL